MAVLKIINKQTPEAFSQSGIRKYQDDYVRADLISYLTRPDKCVYHGAYGVHPDHAAYEMWQTARSWGNDRQLRVRHWVLSFSAYESRTLEPGLWNHLQIIADDVCSLYVNQYQMFYAIHRHPTHNHIHFVMNPVNYRTGRKFQGRKKDYYALQNAIGQHLKYQYGMDLQTVTDHGNENDKSF